MPAAEARPGDDLLTVWDAADILLLSPRTLDRYRADGTGPAYYKLGGRVRYKRSDLMAWVEQNRRTPGRDDEDNGAGR